MILNLQFGFFQFHIVDLEKFNFAIFPYLRWKLTLSSETFGPPFIGLLLSFWHGFHLFVNLHEYQNVSKSISPNIDSWLKKTEYTHIIFDRITLFYDESS